MYEIHKYEPTCTPSMHAYQHAGSLMHPSQQDDFYWEGELLTVSEWSDGVLSSWQREHLGSPFLHATNSHVLF